MMKDCYELEIVDNEKYRECAECAIYGECTGTVYAQNAKTVAVFGQSLGLLLGFVVLVFSAFLLPSHTMGGAWGLILSIIYILAVFRAGKEARGRYDEDRDALKRAAEAI